MRKGFPLVYQRPAGASVLVLSLCPKQFPQICALCQICNFCSNKRTFFKKALVFFCEKCYLVSNKSGSWIQSKTTRFLSTALGFILLFIMLFSSFTFLSFTLSFQDKKSLPQPARGSDFFVCAQRLCLKAETPCHFRQSASTFGIFGTLSLHCGYRPGGGWLVG